MRKEVFRALELPAFYTDGFNIIADGSYLPGPHNDF